MTTPLSDDELCALLVPPPDTDVDRRLDRLATAYRSLADAWRSRRSLAQEIAAEHEVRSLTAELERLGRQCDARAPCECGGAGHLEGGKRVWWVRCEWARVEKLLAASKGPGAAEVSRWQVRAHRAVTLASQALEFAQEGWSYANDYFKEKWRYEDELGQLRLELEELSDEGTP